MRRVVPKVFLVGETKIDFDGMEDYLKHLGGGAIGWLEKYTQGNHPDPLPCPSQPELLSEFYGRVCYRAWKPGLNANVTKIREGNDVYLENILKVKHGSVIEHAVVNLVFADVSRVFTHELVRHRAGVAISQESLRFVRLTDLGLWLPPEAEAHPWVVELFEKTYRDLEQLQITMAARLGLDDEGVQFAEKKVLTSMMRRLAPEGMSTTIGASCNFRALRHILTMRSPKGAEAEMKVVMDQLGPLCKARWPNFFQDFERESDGTWKPKYEKV
jgi:thymidylate synthase (FAD)